MKGVDVEAKVVCLLKNITGHLGLQATSDLEAVMDGPAALQRIVSGLSQAFNIELTYEALSRCAQVRDISALVRRSPQVMSLDKSIPEVQGNGGERIVHVPANRFTYFLRREQQLSAWITCGPIWKLSAPVDHGVLERGVSMLMLRHESLRLKGRMTRYGWMETIASPDEELPITRMDLSENLEQRQAQLDEQLCVVNDAWETSTPLIRIVAGSWGRSQSGYIWILLHHLLVDDLSFRLIIDELMDFYHSTSVAVTRTSATFTQYASHCLAYYEARATEQLKWWQARPWENVSAPFDLESLPGNRSEERFTIVSASAVMFNDRDRLAKAAARSGVTIGQLAVIASGYALCDWFDRPAINLGLVTHGRGSIGGISTLGTVGWLSEVVPMIVSRAEGAYGISDVRLNLQQVISRAKSYGVLSELCSQAWVRRAMRELPPVQISLNVKVHPEVPLAWPTVQKIDCPVSVDKLTLAAKRVYPLSGGVYFMNGALFFSWDHSCYLMSSEEGSTLARLSVEWFRRIFREVTGWELSPLRPVTQGV